MCQPNNFVEEPPAKVKQEDTIIVPGMNSPELIDPICKNLDALYKGAEAISIWRPFRAYWRVQQIRRQQQDLTKNYSSTLGQVYQRMGEPVEEAASEASWLQIWAAARGLASAAKLQSSWQQLDSVIDRKSAYAIACFSIYIAIASMVLTTVFGFLSINWNCLTSGST